jgi:hypothetical protein
MSATSQTEASLFQALNGVPPVDFARNLQVALTQGRHVTALLREVIALRRSPGKISPQEFFYYRLWDRDLSMAAKRQFVGKRAQHRMHVTCNDRHWFSVAADKILFHTIMAGAAFPVPKVLAVTQEGRVVGGAETLTTAGEVARLLRRADLYPLFAKPAAGKYSLSVVSAEAYDASRDEIVLLCGARRPVGEVAASLVGGAGYLVQSRLSPSNMLAAMFGPRLWSVRLLMLLGEGEPTIHRAAAKIAIGDNPADNYWRPGNMLGAIDIATGQIVRTVRGTGADLTVNEEHPDTGHSVVGAQVPDWSRLVTLVKEAASIFAGIRTQSWDVALTDRGPVILEVNFGGDLNLHQLAHGAGVLDLVYDAHLRRCGYQPG